MLEVEIQKIDVSKREAQRSKDWVAEERQLHLFLNRVFYLTILCYPSDLEELAVGHLISEGIIDSVKEIEEITIEEDVCRIKLAREFDVKKRLGRLNHLNKVILSACGSKGSYKPSPRLAKIKSISTVKADTILECASHLNHSAHIYRKTGGVHAAAIFKTDGTKLAFAEDVGRHNAVDKAIGKAAVHMPSFSDCILVLTGRLTADIVMKAARVGLPIVASIAAALDSGIAIAKKVDLTLVGFVRGRRMNVYTRHERISL